MIGDSGQEPEGIPLPHGDVTDGVMRVGDTVRRPVGPHSSLVHDALSFLEHQGFDGAPRYRGIDGSGREILTFVEGEVAWRPWPAWIADDGRASSVARLLRRLDDVMQGYGIPDTYVPEPEPLGAPVSIDAAPHFISHRDVTPENVVFRDGNAHALIDFDLAAASSRTLSLVNLLVWWAPLMPFGDREEALREVDAIARARLLADAYGFPTSQREHLVDVAINHTDRVWFFMRERASRLGGGWERMWRRGQGDRVRRRAAWLRDHDSELRAALVASPVLPDPVVVAAVAVWSLDGRLLTVRKRGTQRFMLPGGKIEPGETFPECARRELAEEVGIVVPRHGLESLGTWHEPAANEPGVVVEATMFDAGVVGHPAAAAAEIAEIRWLDLRESLAEDLAPLLVAALPTLTQRRMTTS